MTANPPSKIDGKLDELESFVRSGKVTMERGDVRALDLPHLFSARPVSDPNEGHSGPVLWLDGDNFFNPYKVSRIARRMGEKPDEILGNIYISRAFTRYQMSSLVLEKTWEGIKKYDPQLLIITGILSLFHHSDIPGNEAEKALDPVLEELGDLGREVEMLLLTSRTGGEPEEGEILSKLESFSDVVLKVVGLSRSVEVELEKHPRNDKQKITLDRLRPEAQPLGRFLGGD